MILYGLGFSVHAMAGLHLIVLPSAVDALHIT